MMARSETKRLGKYGQTTFNRERESNQIVLTLILLKPKNCLKFDSFGTKRPARIIERCFYCRGRNCKNLISLRPKELSVLISKGLPIIAVIGKSPCFRGNRDSIKFGTFATKETVGNVEVPMTRTMR